MVLTYLAMPTLCSPTEVLPLQLVVFLSLCLCCSGSLHPETPPLSTPKLPHLSRLISLPSELTEFDFWSSDCSLPGSYPVLH